MKNNEFTMKLYITFFISILIIGHAHSQNTLTVNNNPGFVANGTTTFTDLQTAIDYATAGDIIYVIGTLHTEPGPISYGSVEINKQVHLIGDGYFADPANGEDKVSEAYTIDLKDGSDNTIIEGFKVKYIKGSSTNGQSIHNITIKNNYIFSSLYIKINNNSKHDGWIIKNNIIKNLWGSTYGNLNPGNVQIINNIILEYIRYLTSSEPIISNNIFLYNGNPFLTVSDATFSSNIFYTSSLDGCTRCTFTNNLVYDPYNQASLSFDYGDNITDGTNIENVDPNFVNATTAYFSWTNDYHLQAGSPALTAGPGSTEIGIYSAEGSPFPDTHGTVSPKILELIIEDRMVEPGQQIQIKVKAEN